MAARRVARRVVREKPVAVRRVVRRAEMDELDTLRIGFVGAVFGLLDTLVEDRVGALSLEMNRCLAADDC